MSHRKPTKTKFNDLWRDEADCLQVVAIEPEMATAWDNIDVGTWESQKTVPDPQEAVARAICEECPVRELCLRDALTDNEAEGIRAGFRFERGMTTKQDSRVIFNEWGLRAKVAKRSRYGNLVLDEDNVESDEVQGMREDSDD